MYNPLDKGRWYRFFIESSEAETKITTGDISGATISGNYLIMPNNYHILDRKYDINYTGASQIVEVSKSYADGREAVALPAKNTFDYGYVYVFAHEKGVV